MSCIIKHESHTIKKLNFIIKRVKTKKYLDKLEERIDKLNITTDDAEYRGIKEIDNLFDLSIGEDYYKPIIVVGTFNNNYIIYESKGDKNKILMPNEYLDMIRS